MRILYNKSLAGRQETDSNARTYIRLAESSLQALRYKCDYPGRYLYNALTHLSRIANSGINIGLYDHLYYSTDKEVPTKDLEFAQRKLQELAARSGVQCSA